jgi:uncharacterized UPF0160 family protein
MQDNNQDKKEITIVTHNSGFHTDDVFAVATLLLAFGDEVKTKVIRSRDMLVIEKADYVLDVGGIYDESINRFDHHQIGGAGIRENGIPYATFGLIWKKYGEILCGDKEVAKKIESHYVEPIDSLDNGVSFIKVTVPGMMPFDIQSLTSMFYPTWKEDMNEIDETFQILVSYAKYILIRIIKNETDDFESENLVREAYKKSQDKRLIILENGRWSWEKILSEFPEPLFAAYENISVGTWSIKAIRNDQASFVSRKKLPQSWAGKTNEELEKITGVKGAKFCHTARFMAVADSKEAILKMAEIALNSD